METSNRFVVWVRRFFTLLLVLIFLAAIGASVYFYEQNQKLHQDPSQAAQKEVDDLVAEVGQVIVLPSGETPTIATVTDPDKLSDQSFFVQAAVGDKVLLYTNAKKAILYRPSTHQIIEVAPINLGQTGSANATPEASVTPAE